MMFDYIFLNIIRALANTSCFFLGSSWDLLCVTSGGGRKEGRHDI